MLGTLRADRGSREGNPTVGFWGLNPSLVGRKIRAESEGCCHRWAGRKCRVPMRNLPAP